MVLDREGDGQMPQNALKYLEYHKDSDMKSNFEHFCIQVKINHWPFVYTLLPKALVSLHAYRFKCSL